MRISTSMNFVCDILTSLIIMALIILEIDSRNLSLPLKEWPHFQKKSLLWNFNVHKFTEMEEWKKPHSFCIQFTKMFSAKTIKKQ